MYARGGYSPSQPFASQTPHHTTPHRAGIHFGDSPQRATFDRTPSASRDGSVVFKPQMPSGMQTTYHSDPNRHAPLVRNFNVLLGQGQQKWYQRDVSCTRVSDLIAILQSRLQMPIHHLLYQGHVLMDTHLPAVPDELKLEIVSGPPQSQGPQASRPITLYIADAPKRVTLEASSVEDLMGKLEQMGHKGDLYLQGPGGNPTPVRSLDDLRFESQVRVIPDRGLYEGPNGNLSRAASYAPRTGPIQANGKFGGPALAPGGGFRAGDAVSLQQVMIEAGQLLINALPYADDDDIARATARVTQQFKLSHAAAEDGRQPFPAETAHLRSIVDQYLLANHRGAGGGGDASSHSRSPLASPALSAAGRHASLFKSVTFGIAGAFPILDAEIDDEHAVSLTPPSRAVAGDNVVVLVHTHTPQPVDIRCTLGYENEDAKVVVINLDEFYVNGWVTIGKTSPSSLFLSFQPDVLRGGVRYFVDVTAFASDDPSVKLGAAQTEFTMRDDELERGADTPSPVHQPAAVQHTQLLQHQHQQHAVVLPEYSYQPAPAAAAAAAVPEYSYQPPPAQRRGTPSSFHRELNSFIENKILPLYSISKKHSFTEQVFRDMVDRACEDLWKLPPDQTLTEQHKKMILARVKQSVLNE